MYVGFQEQDPITSYFLKTYLKVSINHALEHLLLIALDK